MQVRWAQIKEKKKRIYASKGGSKNSNQKAGSVSFFLNTNNLIRVSLSPTLLFVLNFSSSLFLSSFLYNTVINKKIKKEYSFSIFLDRWQFHRSSKHDNNGSFKQINYIDIHFVLVKNRDDNNNINH